VDVSRYNKKSEGNFHFREGIFKPRDTVAPPAALMLLLTLQKRGLCRLEVNCVVKFSYFFRIEEEVRDGRG
jgi:hypothetical protein